MWTAARTLLRSFCTVPTNMSDDTLQPCTEMGRGGMTILDMWPQLKGGGLAMTHVFLRIWNSDCSVGV